MPDKYDERMWEVYVMDCRTKQATPDISDFLVWMDENY